MVDVTTVLQCLLHLIVHLVDLMEIVRSVFINVLNCSIKEKFEILCWKLCILLNQCI